LRVKRYADDWVGRGTLEAPPDTKYEPPERVNESQTILVILKFTGPCIILIVE